MKGYLLKEYGSWTVTGVAFLVGVVYWTTPDYRSLLSLLLATFLFINSKQAMVLWIKRGQRRGLLGFLTQIALSGLMILLAGPPLAPLFYGVSISALYLFLFHRLGEHHILTETVGFGVLTLPALVISAMNGHLYWRLYLVAWLFFVAGVLRVRVQLTKTTLYRVLMVLYPILLAVAFPLLGYTPLTVLPLIENVAYSLLLYPMKLRCTGWTELTKAVLLLLVIMTFQNR